MVQNEELKIKSREDKRQKEERKRKGQEKTWKKLSNRVQNEKLKIE